jgi:hypothetical protein
VSGLADTVEVIVDCAGPPEDTEGLSDIVGRCLVIFHYHLHVIRRQRQKSALQSSWTSRESIKSEQQCCSSDCPFLRKLSSRTSLPGKPCKQGHHTKSFCFVGRTSTDSGGTIISITISAITGVWRNLDVKPESSDEVLVHSLYRPGRHRVITEA